MKIQKVMIVFTIALLALLLAGAMFALLDYMAHGDDYRFGTEVAGFSYRSAYHYVGTAVAQTVLSACAIAFTAPLMTRRIATSTKDAIAMSLVLATVAVAFGL